MNFEEYQKKSRETALYPNLGNNFIYPTLGLCGEAGEVAEKIKKIIRDNHGKINQERKVMLEKELGDVLWYLANLSTELDLSLNNIAHKNLEKLAQRLQKGTVHGDGDNR
jgi:NTP pyrophosphatase (non-canonical NTP hydrolase)